VPAIALSLPATKNERSARLGRLRGRRNDTRRKEPSEFFLPSDLRLRLLNFPQGSQSGPLLGAERSQNGREFMFRGMKLSGGDLGRIQQENSCPLLAEGEAVAPCLSCLIGFSFFAGRSARPFRQPGYRSRPPPPRSRSCARLARYHASPAYRFASCSRSLSRFSAPRSVVSLPGFACRESRTPSFART
jgi:hypothetical protein